MVRNVWSTGLLVGLLAACGRGAQDAADAEYADGVPEFTSAAAEVTGAAGEGLTSQALEQGLNAGAPALLVETREAVRGLNGAVKAALDALREMVDAGGGVSSAGEVRTYGPADKEGLTWRLRLKKLGVARFAFRLEAKAVGAGDDSYAVVLEGALRRGTEARRGRGILLLDLDALAALKPSLVASGKVAASFVHLPAGRAWAYRVQDFTPDVAAVTPFRAAFVGHLTQVTGVRRMRFAAPFNLDGTPTAAREFVLGRVRHLPGVGGRVDVLAGGGDAGPNEYFLGSACWDAQESEGFAALVRCTKGQPLTACVVVTSRGDKATCGQGLSEAATPADGTAEEATAETDSPVGDPGDPGSVTSAEDWLSAQP